MGDETGLAEGLSEGVEDTGVSTLGVEPPAETTDAVETATEAPTYTVKVNGEDSSVTLDELLSGYQRQSDYTRKTQDIARQAEALKRAAAIQEAFERNPREAMQALADAYGVDIAPTVAADDELLDPVERELRDLKQSLAQMQRTARHTELDNTISSLRETYGDFDEESLFAHSLKTGIKDLRAAYRDMTYDDRVAEQRAAADAAAKQAAKRESLGAVHEGGIPKSAVRPKQGTALLSVRDAWEESMKELGLAV